MACAHVWEVHHRQIQHLPCHQHQTMVPAQVDALVRVMLACHRHAMIGVLMDCVVPTVSGVVPPLLLVVNEERGVSVNSARTVVVVDVMSQWRTPKHQLEHVAWLVAVSLQFLIRQM